MVFVFGTWDAPITDGAQRLLVPPTDRTCMHCQEHFRPHDNGAILPTGFATHRECHLRGVMGGIGHLVDHERYCHGPLGPDAGLTYRQSAWLVWRQIYDGEPVSVDELEALRAIEQRYRL